MLIVLLTIWNGNLFLKINNTITFNIYIINTFFFLKKIHLIGELSIDTMNTYLVIFKLQLKNLVNSCLVNIINYY